MFQWASSVQGSTASLPTVSVSKARWELMLADTDSDSTAALATGRFAGDAHEALGAKLHCILTKGELFIYRAYITVGQSLLLVIKKCKMCFFSHLPLIDVLF